VDIFNVFIFILKLPACGPPYNQMVFITTYLPNICVLP